MITQAFAISIPLDTATPEIQRVIAGIRGSKNLARYGARAVQQKIGEHVRRYAAEHHATAEALGASPTGFFSDAYEQVTSEGAVTAEPGFAKIALPRNAFARAFGDVDITPGNGKKYLTFAACAAAYGRRSQSFGNLQFGMAVDPETGNLRPALVEPPQQKVKFGRARKDGSRKVTPGEITDGRAPVYWLVTKAHQKQIRELLPSDGEISAAAAEGAADYIGELIRQKGGAA